MAWGVVTYKGPLLLLEKNLNGKNYMKLLQNDFMPNYENHLPLHTFFQQDNAPPHRCQAAQKYIEKNIIFTMHWPPQSRDLNVIENVWQFVKRQLKHYKSKTKKELINNVNEIWQPIPISLMHSMSSRIEAVDKSKGYPTKY